MNNKIWILGRDQINVIFRSHDTGITALPYYSKEKAADDDNS